MSGCKRETAPVLSETIFKSLRIRFIHISGCIFLYAWHTSTTNMPKSGKGGGAGKAGGASKTGNPSGKNPHK